MQVSFDPLNPQEAKAVQTLLALTAARVPDGSQPAPVAPLAAPPGVALASEATGVLVSSQGITLAPGAVPPAAGPPPPKSHKKKAAPAPPQADPAPAAAPPAAPPATVPPVGDLLANSTTPPADAAPAPAPTGAKPLTVEDVRAAYRELFAVIGDEKGKEELRTVLAKAGSATVSDLKPEHFAAVVRSLNAAAILAKSKGAPAAAAAPAKDPLL